MCASLGVAERDICAAGRRRTGKELVRGETKRPRDCRREKRRLHLLQQNKFAAGEGGWSVMDCGPSVEL